MKQSESADPDKVVTSDVSPPPSNTACVCGSDACMHWRNAETKRLRRELGWVRAALLVDGQPVALSRDDAIHVLRYLDSAISIATRLAR